MSPNTDRERGERRELELFVRLNEVLVDDRERFASKHEFTESTYKLQLCSFGEIEIVERLRGD